MVWSEVEAPGTVTGLAGDWGEGDVIASVLAVAAFVSRAAESPGTALVDGIDERDDANEAPLAVCVAGTSAGTLESRCEIKGEAMAN
jgi:hypothetical protein